MMENRYYQQPIDAVLIDNDLNAQVCNDELNLSVNEALLVDSPSVVHYNKEDNKSFSEKLQARKNIGLENVQDVLQWSDENHPNTLSGYSITDAYINNKQVVLGNKILTTCDDQFYVHTDNNFDDTQKNKLQNIEDNAQVNVIEEIQVNNVKQNPDQNKVVRITMPTKVSDLENDKNYQTAQEVSQSISEHNLSTNSHNDIRQAISDETTARTEADEQLSIAIENESSARTEGEQRLSEALQTEITQRQQADTQLTTSITDEVNTRSQQYTSLNSSIQTETASRISGDSNLQSQIDAITSKSDVVDVVGTHAELEAYIKPIYKDDIVKVLVDETHGNAITYYRLTTDVEPPEQPEPPYTWTYIGASGPYYTKSETDTQIENAIKELDYTSPSADGSGIQFIDTISQNDGQISATKKSVRQASTSQTGVVQLSNATDSDSESTAATSKALKDVATNAGKIDSIEFNGEELPIENKKVSIDESDPIFKRSPAYGISTTDISKWNNKAEVSDIPTKTSELNNDSGFTSMATIIVTSAMIISQSPLIIQLNSEQDNIIKNDAIQFIKLDASTLDMGVAIFCKSISSETSKYILVNTICTYTPVTSLISRSLFNCIIYDTTTKQGVYSTLQVADDSEVVKSVNSISPSTNGNVNINAVPTGGTTDQVLTKTDDGYGWEDPHGGASTERYQFNITGDGTTSEFIINHDLNDLQVLVLLYDNIIGQPYTDVLVDIQRLDANNIKLVFENAPAVGENYLGVCFLPGGTEGLPGSSIYNIVKTSTEGLVDTYTIMLTDGTTSTFNVTNGRDGSVISVNSRTGAVTVNEVPNGGTTNQVLTKTDSGYSWADSFIGWTLTDKTEVTDI